MPTFPGFRAVVERNGSDVPFSQVTFNREAGHLTPAWSISFPYPILVSLSDTWTIRRGLVGSMQTLVANQRAGNLTAEDGVSQYARTVSGVGRQGTADATTDLLDFCIPKTYVFVNQQWLGGVVPSAQLQNGIIVAGGSYNSGFAPVAPTRLFLARLPGKEVKDNDFQCFIGQWTHRSVAQKLAQMIGYRLHSNIPDIPVQTTYTVVSGTTWFDAIKAGFTLWQPSILLDGKTIYVLDTMGSLNQIPGVQRLSLTNSVITSATVTDESGGNKQVIDHVIIKGRKQTDTLKKPKPQPNEAVQVIELAECELEPNRSRSYETAVEGVFAQKNASPRRYTGSFEQDENAFTPHGLGVHRMTEWDYVNEEAGIEKRIHEVNDSFRDDGELVHRVVKHYYYSSNFELVGTLEQEFGLLRHPGPRGPDGKRRQIFTLAKAKTVQSGKFVTGKNMKRALSNETVEQLVLVEKTDDGLKLSPMPLLTVLRSDYARDMIDSTQDSKQDVLWVRTNESIESLSRGDEGTLEIKRIDYDLIADVAKLSSQTLKNPLQKPGEQTSKSSSIFRREYFDQGAGRVINGVRCYHKPVELTHEDIDSAEIAEALADRVFARRGQGSGVTVKISTPVPIPINSCNFIVSLPSISYDVSGSTVTVPGGDSVLKSVSESIGFSGQTGSNRVKLNYSMTLTLKSGF